MLIKKVPVILTCEAHASKPDPILAMMPAESFVGHHIKKRFTQENQSGSEHMWVKITRVIDKNTLEGWLDNYPTRIASVQYKDTVQVKLIEIEAAI